MIIRSEMVVFFLFTLKCTFIIAYISKISIAKGTAPVGVSSLLLQANANPFQHEFQIEGMSCGGCANKIQSALRLNYDNAATVSFNDKLAKVAISGNATATVNKLLQSLGNYKAIEIQNKAIAKVSYSTLYSLFKLQFQIFQPIILIFTFVTISSALPQIIFTKTQNFNLDTWMRHFMGVFYIVFGCFKLTNLKGFVRAYSSYDIVAGKNSLYAWIYPFIEVSLGLFYLSNRGIMSINILSFIMKTLSAVGVFFALKKKQQLECACLGTLFKLPMTYLTLFEDILMVIMAFFSLLRTHTM